VPRSSTVMERLYQLEPLEKSLYPGIFFRKGAFLAWIRGLFNRVCDRYFRDEEQTAKVMKRDPEGELWMHTGDEGVLDEQGYLRSAFHLLSVSATLTPPRLAQLWEGLRT